MKKRKLTLYQKRVQELIRVKGDCDKRDTELLPCKNCFLPTKKRVSSFMVASGNNSPWKHKRETIYACVYRTNSIRLLPKEELDAKIYSEALKHAAVVLQPEDVFEVSI